MSNQADSPSGVTPITHVYFVSYYWNYRYKGGNGYGRVEMKLDAPISTTDQVRQIEEFVENDARAQGLQPQSCVVLNYQLLRTEP